MKRRSLIRFRPLTDRLLARPKPDDTLSAEPSLSIFFFAPPLTPEPPRRPGGPEPPVPASDPRSNDPAPTARSDPRSARQPGRGPGAQGRPGGGPGAPGPSGLENLSDYWLVATVSGVLTWFVPGLGHVFLGDRTRALILGVTVLSLWFSGLLIGGVGVIDRVNNRPWFLGQMLLAPSVVLDTYHQAVLKKSPRYPPLPNRPHDYQPSFGRVYEQGVLYTALSGLLNVLVMIDVVAQALGGSRQAPGRAAERSGRRGPGSASARRRNLPEGSS